MGDNIIMAIEEISISIALLRITGYKYFMSKCLLFLVTRYSLINPRGFGASYFRLVLNFSYGYFMCVFLIYIIVTCYTLNSHYRLVRG